MTKTGMRGRQGGRRRTSWTEIDFSVLSQRARKLSQTSFWLVVAATVLGMAVLMTRAQAYLLPFAAITVPTLIGIRLWAWSPGQGLPLLPLFLAQQGLIYGFPLSISKPEAGIVSLGTMTVSGLTVGLFLSFVTVGWAVGRESFTSRPSRTDIRMGAGTGRLLSLTYTLLGVALLFHLANRTGLIFQLLPGPLVKMFPVIRTFAGSASMLGAMLGGAVIGGRPKHIRNWIYWGLLAAIGVLAVADVLLSPASGLILAAAVGLAFGKRKAPWEFLLVTFCMLGLLNQGKFVMRDRYWDKNSNSSGVTLLQLPAFYGEWALASSGTFLGGSKGRGQLVSTEDEGQLIFQRLNNLQNVTFVVDALKRPDVQPLWGETYTLIPPLLVPRFLWPDKPTAHEGQILLNLHFGRQATREQTQKTFIAWGLLPEAIGNFGVWLGPVLAGAFYGFLMGGLERVSMRKRLLSIEGLVLVTLLLLLAASYEMVASVLVTSMFQALVAVVIGGWLLREWFGHDKGAGMGEAGKKRKTAQRRISEIKQ